MRVADLYHRGYRRQPEIVRELKDQFDIEVNRATVSRDLKALSTLWQESSAISIKKAKAEILEEINELKKEYHTAWERSVGERTRKMTKQVDTGGGKRSEAQIQKEDMLGDPRFLDGVQWCIERRCKILGIDAPEHRVLSNEDGSPLLPLDKLVEALRAADEALSSDDR